eukprot:TRINITY_DN519_c0_g1_i1.p1 TRINITY_DN519_c0_g1~~TRINITY_DN519_c0_g1_i1.p1  ORF type:complete len:621 (-),score=111.87 TRINITY_DN519_c0_g1_i1:23-1885(-)
MPAPSKLQCSARRTTTLLVALLAASGVNADVYMHMLRGSNNRWKSGVNADNQNRLFNSQNNAKGGYNVGEGGVEKFYAGSELLLEWTAQHGCGNANVECQIILQYMCKDGNPNLRDGKSETTPSDTGGGDEAGQHEPYSYYDDCRQRQRNEGLFVADRRNFQNNRFLHAQHTRQNENGDRRGYECQEERDYYPYWHPTPWRDIAVLVDKDRLGMCSWYQAESENVKGRGSCTMKQHNSKQACEEGRMYYPRDEEALNKERDRQRAAADVTYYQMKVDNGDSTKQSNLDDAKRRLQDLTSWVDQWRQKNKGTWQVSQPLDPQKKHPLKCRVNDFSRDNHLGNVEEGQPASFLWKVPDTPSDACVLRLRYNMSSTDYSSWGTWAEKNADKSPIYQNMKVDVGVAGKVELAINTNQIGRTFQDRSHVFQILARSSSGIATDKRIVNINVRGKRGNIVQAFPAVEYDFHPNRAVICEGDYVHFQWTGSDANPNNYAGQGRAGTDRSNIVEIGPGGSGMDMNKPLPLKDVRMFPAADGTNDVAVTKKFALLEQTNDLLNDAPAYFWHAPLQYNKAAVYHYMCTRNNNFSNRSHKAQLEVLPKSDARCQGTTRPQLQPGADMSDLL